jgi:GDPmannose 4,6-dehydratase
MWLMLQRDTPGDYVIATGVTHSVRELAETAFARVGLDWAEHVRVDDALVRGKAELHDLVGDASKAREGLGWSPTLDFEGLVHLLVDSDLARLRAGLELAEPLADR